MKKIFYSLAMLSLIASSCSEKENIIEEAIDPSNKEMISFSLSDEAQTRVGFRESATRILMRIQCDDRHSTSPSDSKYTRLLASAAKDEMDISTDENKAHAYSVVSLNDDPRYWDDAYGRYSLLSVYAIAIANKNDASLLPLTYMYDGAGTKSATTNTVWGVSTTANVSDNTISFTVETSSQTKTTIGNQDLVYSNNIQAHETLGKDGVYRWDFTKSAYEPSVTGKTTHSNGRMLFYQDGTTLNPLDQPTDAPGKFDKGHLVFKHALSRLTVTLVEGTGFNSSSTDDFKFNSGNIKLLGMNTTGTLDVKTGVWTPGTATAINQMAPSATYTTADGTFAAQMLPDYEFKDGNSTNVMEFTIDNNTYYITQDMVYDALVAVAANKDAKYGYDESSSKFKMMQGHNYALTITVKKTAIEAITATLADWVDVNGEYAIDNSHITVTTKKIEESGDAACNEFNFYRFGEPLDKIYTDASYSANKFSGDYKTEGRATKSETGSGTKIWNTNWFYNSNKIAYHFRTLNNLASSGSSSGTDDANISNTTGGSIVSSFAMESGSQSTHDYHWGAPMQSNATLAYDTEKGFASSIHKGIVAPKNNTSNTINITELHMMSNINIRLITDSVSYVDGGTTKYKIGPAAVNLENAAITLTRFAKTGSVDMGTGKISPTYTVPSPLAHNLDGDSDCAKIDAPSFTGTCWWLHANSIQASTDWYSYAVVPQALRRKDSDYTEADCIGITIRTIDNNEYYVIKDLANIIATSVTSSSSLSATRDQAENANILRWYPGHTYNYTIKITKKGIESITATVADWVTVNAKQIDISLED